jgi:sec-independent protein translocase protein TatC
MGYYVLPTGLTVLISFVPHGATSLIDYAGFFSFEMRMLLIFGISMEIPLFVVLLNFAGIISGRALAKNRPWIIIGTMVFAAVATPSTDPFSMLMLAIPMCILFIISEIIARVSDRVRGRGAHSTDQWADDEISPI